MELTTIKWLLIAILVCVVIIAVSFATIAFVSLIGLRFLKENRKTLVFKNLAEHYLSEGDNEALIEYANERIQTNPQDYLPYWYLGKVQYHQGEYVEAKYSFEKVIELDPTMDFSAGKWLDDIADKLEQGPQLVE